MKTISINLSESSIDDAIKQVRQYKNDINRKTLLLLDRMLKYGEDYAINAVGHVDSGETLSTISGYRNGNRGVIVAGGNAIWIEFGTGVRYNGSAGSSPHPMGEELGMRIGEYGKKQGANPSGWWYYDENKLRHTYGIKANMFMYKTAQELVRIAPELAREVFAK